MRKLRLRKEGDLPRVKQHESIDLVMECRSFDPLFSDFCGVPILLGAHPFLFNFFLFIKHFKMILLQVNSVTSKLKKKPTVSSLNCFNIKASSRKKLEIDLVAKMN